MEHSLINKTTPFSILTISALIVCGNFLQSNNAFAQNTFDNQKQRFNIPLSFLKLPKSMVDAQRRADELQTKTPDELQYESARDTMYQPQSSPILTYSQAVKPDAKFSDVAIENDGKKVYKFDIDEAQTKTTTIYKDEVVVLKAPIRQGVAPTVVGSRDGYYNPAQKGTYNMPAVRTGSQIITTYPTTTIRTEITETDFAKSITTQGQNDFQQEQWIRKKADTARRMYEKSKSQKLNTFGAIVLRHDSGLDLQASPPKGDNTYAKSEKVYVIPVVQEQQFVDKEIKDLRENNLPTEDAQPAIVLEKSFMVKEQKDALKAQGKAEKKSENKVDDNSKIEKKSVNSVSENNASDNKKIERNEVFKSFVYAPNRPISANEYSSVNSQDDVKLGIDGIITKAQEKKSETEKLLLKVDEELSPGSIPTSANQ